MILRPRLLLLSGYPTARTASRCLSSAATRLSDTGKGHDAANTRKKQVISESRSAHPSSESHNPKTQKQKSVAQMDAELRERLEQMSGDGGAAGIEYEDGQPNAMKRSVRENMFRYI